MNKTFGEVDKEAERLVREIWMLRFEVAEAVNVLMQVSNAPVLDHTGMAEAVNVLRRYSGSPVHQFTAILTSDINNLAREV